MRSPGARSTLSLTLLAAGLTIVLACGGPVAPPVGTGSTSTPSTTTTSTSPSAQSQQPIADVAVGPVGIQPINLDLAADFNGALAASEEDDRDRGRVQAGFEQEVGAGWAALSRSADEAIDAAAQAVADELAVDLPIADGRPVAAIGAPAQVRAVAHDSAASALAIVTAALTAGQALGQGGTRSVSKTETRNVTEGDEVATVTVKMSGTITSSGSRVTADFTFELTGSVTNSVTGATAQMRGSATARVEIDGCPDASGSSLGKVSLSSSESATGSGEGSTTSASWTRDLSGDFDISVDDDASISGLAIDAEAQESVVSTTQEADDDPETDSHELGVGMHYEYAAGRGFDGIAPIEDASDGSVLHEEDATEAHLAPLFKSAASAIMVAAVGLGQSAEAFWRDGKCIEVVVEPEGGDVDADSETSVTAKVRHVFEGDELDKPVEATLAGVASIDPADRKQPAPATFVYTAGPEVGDEGEIEFESVSNRGIGRKTVTFTVRASGWVTNADTPLGQIRGLKCGEVGGEWTVQGTEDLAAFEVTTLWTINIDEESLAGTYTHEKVQTGLGTVTTSRSNGPARAVLNDDGTVRMTLDAAQITLTTVNSFGGSGTATTPGLERIFEWTLDTEGSCADV